jgi:hypothetical protein
MGNFGVCRIRDGQHDSFARIRLIHIPVEIDGSLVGRRTATAESKFECSVQRPEALADRIAPLNIEPAHEILHFATIVFCRNLGLLKRPPQVFIPMPEVFNNFVPLFGTKAMFHSTPFPFRLIWQRIWLVHKKLASSPITPNTTSRVCSTFPSTSISRFFKSPAVTWSMC